MKRAFVAFAVVLLTANALSASGMYLESPQATCYLCGPTCGGPCQLYFDPSFPVYELIVWIIPDAHGVIGASLKVEWPINVVPITITQNSLISASLGSLQAGLSFTLSECQYSLFWTHRMSFLITDPSPGFIYLRPYPDVDLIVISCEPGNPVISATGAGAWLGLNSAVGVRKTSWGAIKSLYNE